MFKTDQEQDLKRLSTLQRSIFKKMANALNLEEAEGCPLFSFLFFLFFSFDPLPSNRILQPLLPLPTGREEPRDLERDRQPRTQLLLALPRHQHRPKPLPPPPSSQQVLHRDLPQLQLQLPKPKPKPKPKPRLRRRKECKHLSSSNNNRRKRRVVVKGRTKRKIKFPCIEQKNNKT